ncbi:MAG: hypothetical protein ACQET5_12620 [Halobacteriota archaeon]
MTMRQDVIERFERWGPTAFIVGGIGLLGTSVVASLDVAGIVPTYPRLNMGPLLFGLWFVFVGLIGLYPRVAKGSPRLSLGGLGTSAIAWVIWSIAMLAAIGVDITTERTIADPGSWGPPLLTVAFVLALLSFLVYGLASTWSERPSRALGLLLLIPVVAFLGQAMLLVSKILTGDVVAVLQLALGGITAIVLIVVGYLLQSDAEQAVTSESRTEPTA